MPEGVASPYPVEVVWEGGMRYRGGPEGGPTHLVDGAREAAPSPVDSLVVSIAACSAIDVVEVLNKRRTPPASLRVRAEFARAPEPPRRLTDVKLVYSVAADTDPSHVERAIQLSFDRYCSVIHSLAPDTRLGWELELEPASAVSG
jgi:putative redox protein